MTPHDAHVTSIAVRFNELDPYAHVNHAVYATYFEVARTQALADIGLSIDELARQGFQFVVTELSLRFRKPAVSADVLSVETWLSEIGRASTRWSQRIRRSDELLVEAELKVGVANSLGRATRPTPAMLATLEALHRTQE
ncbi:MAG: thioesterase family protein [Actinomycetota bacterium]|nr:thioesterase family protein [Actinomycetota bacterium]